MNVKRRKELPCYAGLNRGFSLIEMIVVIAIIALLAAILYPVFARAREKARAASCQSNLKQIGLAFLQYAQDNDEKLPHAWDSDLTAPVTNSPGICANCIVIGNTNLPLVWPAKIEPYTKSRQIFSCPDATTPMTSPCTTNNALVAKYLIPVWADGAPVVGGKVALGAYWYQGASQVTYGYNAYYLGGNRYPGNSACLNQGDIARPSLPYSNGIGAPLSSIADSTRTVLVAENSFSRQGLGNAPAIIDFPSFRGANVDIYGDIQCYSYGAYDQNDSMPTRHSDGLNVAFLDGHVKWMKKETLLYGSTVEDCTGTAAIHSSTDPNFLWNRF